MEQTEKHGNDVHNPMRISVAKLADVTNRILINLAHAIFGYRVFSGLEPASCFIAQKILRFCCSSRRAGELFKNSPGWLLSMSISKARSEFSLRHPYMLICSLKDSGLCSHRGSADSMLCLHSHGPTCLWSKAKHSDLVCG